MLLHQFIVVLVATVKRFETALLSALETVRRTFSDNQASVTELEFEEAETERAA